ncbi:tetratricopeptide repeat protein [Streptomyces echinoruber]|uniref:NTPase n=1 Tax=Streptomyces echinoruber TaxID=68898 RepID=A0A918R977_9ACTN|nr:tetratricopeptide repeat protein [Streptomyces echinoruber]GGZ89929.1 NTPase [Streptomyces echinoruber]
MTDNTDNQADEPLKALAPVSHGNDLSGVVYGPSVQAHQIHGGITFQVQPPPAPGPDVRPDEVPPVLFDFINRTEELARLNALFGDHSEASARRVGLGLVYGLRGVGKTSMISYWAEHGRRLFPDGQIYVDFDTLGGRSGGGDVSEAARHCLRALGVGEPAIPSSLEERVAMFRSCSARRRLLVVLDNVRHPGQVRALLPKGPGSVLLATSHARLGELIMLGAKLLELPPFDRASGLRLLAAWCGEEQIHTDRSAAERVVDLCCGLPEALSVLAARLQTTPGLTVTRLADELADETRRLAGMSLGEEHSVSAVFDLTYRELPPDAARMYRLAAWIPGRAFDTGTAAAAAGLAPGTAQALLRTLEKTRLLDKAMPDGRYRFHDLVRLHARQRAEEEEPDGARQGVIHRVVRHYLALTAFADRAVRQDRLRIADLTDLLRGAADPFASVGGPAPLDWLEAEHRTLLDVLRAAWEAGLATEVWQLAEAFTVLFLHHRHLAIWRESLELGARAAARCVEPAAEGRLRSLLSRPLMDLGEFDTARAELERAAACAEVSGHLVLQASVQEFLGRYWEHCDIDRAIASYQRSVELNIEAGERRGAAIAAYFLGCAQDARGDHAAALDTLLQARRRLLAVADARMAARATLAIGVAYDHLGRPAEAIDALSEAAEMLRAQKAAHYEAQALLALADIEERTGAERAAVRAHLTRAWEIYTQEGNPAADRVRERLDGRYGTE